MRARACVCVCVCVAVQVGMWGKGGFQGKDSGSPGSETGEWGVVRTLDLAIQERWYICGKVGT